MKDKLDLLVEKFTIYQLTLYGLLVLAVYTLGLAFVGALDFNPLTMLIHLIVLVTIACIINSGFARLLHVETNFESTFITSLVLFFMFSPPSDGVSYLTPAALGAIAAASKYLFVWRRRHVFNPAVVAATVCAITGLDVADWWVGSWMVIPVVAVIGGVIVYKARQIQMAGLYVAVIWVVMAVQLLAGQPVDWTIVLSAVFFALFVLTDPLTQPPRRHQRHVYAIGVAFVVGIGVQVGQVVIMPEIALLFGNVFAFFCGQRGGISLTLVSRALLPNDQIQYTFKPRGKLRLETGQYIEIQLAGTRRRFAIATNSTSTRLKIITPHQKTSNGFLKTLLHLPIDSTISTTGIYDTFVDGASVPKQAS